MWEALRYPLRGEHAEKTLLSAWLCVLLHAIVLPVLALLPLVGYAATVLARGEEPTPPPFLEWSLLARSLGAAALTIGYMTVPVGATLVTILLFLDGEPPAEAEVLFFFVGSTAALFVLAFFAYLLPIALANYVREGSVKEGVKNLVGVAGHAAYFVGWASGTVLFLLGGAVSSALLDAGGLFTVMGSFVGGYAVIVGSRRIGRGYAAAR